MAVAAGSHRVDWSPMTIASLGDILLVDDSPENLSLLSGLLKQDGYKVRAFLDGRVALEKAQTAPPDLILLDVEMPQMNGYEVCAALKQHETLRRVPVLFISALTDTADKLKGFTAGGVDYITKPFQAAEVRARVEAHLTIHRLQHDLERQNEELRRLESLRDSLMHMIVHDLRSPLTSIVGYLDMLKSSDNLTHEEVQEYTKAAGYGASALLALINSLLDINALEAGQMRLHKEPSDIGVLASRALMPLEGLTVGRDVSLGLPAQAVTVDCDPQIIERVIMNLLGNALKFTPAKGSIVVAVMQNGERCRVEVRDTGRGIPPEYLERVFDKFQQVEARKERKMYSTGLGLTFCKLAVEAHQGQIGVNSTVGVGSTFWFELDRQS
jgi:two-component system sensor histidine kinase/response regulator